MNGAWRKSEIKLMFMFCFFSAIVPVSTVVAAPPAHVPRFNGAPGDTQPVYSATSTVHAYSSVELISEGYSGPVQVVFSELSIAPDSGSELTRIQYALFRTNGSSLLSTTGNPASSQETLSGAFPPGSKKHDRLSLGFRIEIAPSSLPPPGIHTITLRADLYTGAFPSSGAAVDSVAFTISVHVNNHYDVSIVPSGAAFSLSATSATIAFGTLRSFDSRGVDILVKSNVSFVLSLESANGGAFANASDAFRIPYSLSANGIAIRLTAGSNTAIGNTLQATYGIPTRFALILTVLQFTDLPTEGAYSDLITVTLSAR